MTALRNVTLAPRRVGKKPEQEAEGRVRELLARVGLGAHADSYPDPDVGRSVFLSRVLNH
jgi:ABC-type polar amino acid transport system ATPase subunit